MRNARGFGSAFAHVVRTRAWARACRRLVVVLAIPAMTLGARLPFAHAESPHHDVLILVYHRFADRVTDSTTVSPETFQSQLRFFAENGFQIVALGDVVAWHTGAPDTLPRRALAVTVDDGHRSVFDVLWPMLKAHPMPVTLFIYPSAISNASYAMTWDQVRTLAQSPDIDVQSHTYWHPNFKAARKRLAPKAFESFSREQLRRSRTRIEHETGRNVQFLAWPFGIYDAQLEAIARDEGYRNGFSIDAKPVIRSSDPMALPRYLMTQQCRTACLLGMLHQAEVGHD